MAKDIFVFVEYKDGGVRKVSLEALTKGRELARTLDSSLYGVVIGSGVTEVAETVRDYADKVLLVDNNALDSYRCDTYTAALEQLVKKYQPSMILGGSTVTGKDLFPRLAARLSAPIISEAVGIRFEEGRLTVKKPLYGGKIVSWLGVKEGRTPIVTFRPNSFFVEKASSQGAVIEEFLDLAPDSRFTILSRDKGSAKKMDLQEADFIICGGRGMKGPENFQILEEIADIMGGRVGASRAVVDSKWREYDDQVGKSGKTVSPKLYIGCGVSGALHHTMGMDTSKVIVAVNKDPNAPIFSYADYGIADDLFVILPILKEELAKTKQEI